MKLKHLFLTSLATACASAGPLAAEGHPYPEAPLYCEENLCCSPCDGFSLGVDLLYWHLCASDLDWGVLLTPPVTEGPIDSRGKFQSICHDYEPGVRVYLTKQRFSCDWDLMLGYTYFHSEETDRLSVRDSDLESEISLNLIHPAASLAGGDVGSARDKFDYQTFEVLFGRSFCWGGDHLFMPFFGVEGLKLNRNFSSEVADLDPLQSLVENVRASHTWKAEVRAVGLKLGAQYSHTLCDCFDLFIKSSVSLLAGESDGYEKSILTVNGTETDPLVSNYPFDNGDCCSFIPGCHLQAGFSWSHCCCGQEMTARIGYEFVEWRNLPTPKRFFSQDLGAAGDSTPGKGALLGMHGLFAGLNFHF